MESVKKRIVEPFGRITVTNSKGEHMTYENVAHLSVRCTPEGKPEIWITFAPPPTKIISDWTDFFVEKTTK